MICLVLLVVCALQGVAWARTMGPGGAADLGVALAHDKGGLLPGVVENEGGLLVGGPTNKGVSGSRSVVELLLKGIREVVRGNATGDFNGEEVQKSLITTAKEFTKDLQEWIEDGDEGRHFKRHKMMARMALWLKTLLLGVVLPGAVAVALFAAWKGITLSLMALLLAGIVGLKGLVSSASSKAAPAPAPTPQHVVVSGLPSHHHHQWRRDPLESPSWSDAAHHIAYRAYAT